VRCFGLAGFGSAGGDADEHAIDRDDHLPACLRGNLRAICFTNYVAWRASVGARLDS
jgi:hypothetical protein